jgi:HPr kinase/phosphorylase
VARTRQAQSPDEGPSVCVRELLSPDASGLRLQLVAGGRGIDRVINRSRVQRPGLALTGYTDYIRYGRVQIIGGSEQTFLAKLPARRRGRILARLAGLPVSCYVITKGAPVPSDLSRAADTRNVPVLATPLDSTPFIKGLTAFLDERLALRLQLHGVLMDVFGLGMLILGDSGIGKSECALELVDRGHRLVADDVIEVKRVAEGLEAASPDLTRHHMEIRGLGVLNVRDLYGVSSIRMVKRVEMVVVLERWEQGKEYDRLGLREEHHTILGVELPLVRMPVAPGRNIALLAEVAARNMLLREWGYDAARRFVERVDATLATPRKRTARRR